MSLDASAVIAIIQREAGFEELVCSSPRCPSLASGPEARYEEGLLKCRRSARRVPMRCHRSIR